MRIILITFVTLVSFFAQAEIFYSDDAEKNSLIVSPYKGVRISKMDCAKSCLAKLAIEKFHSQKNLKLSGRRGENPTSHWCEQLAGIPDIFHDSSKSEVSVCVFRDKSFFVSWDLIK